MKLLSICVVTAFLLIFLFPISMMAAEDIYGLKIENIDKTGADFYWSTSIETKGSIEYAYTKLPQLYNPQPQTPQASVNILVSVTPSIQKTEDHYRKAHHIRVDNLDLYIDPFIQYTIKSVAYDGAIYTLSGEFVLVDTKKINWWQTWQFAIFMPLTMFVLGQITRPLTLKLWKLLRGYIHR